MKYHIFTKYALAMLLPVLIITSCTEQNLDDPHARNAGLLLDQENELLSGHITNNDYGIHYQAKRIDQQTFSINVKLKDHHLKALVAYAPEKITMDGQGSMLLEEEKMKLLDLAQSVFDYVDHKTGDITLLEYSLVRMLEYWSRSPVGYVYEKVDYDQPDKSVLNTERLGNEGIKCIKRGRYVNAEYDDARGRHSDRVKVGSKARANYGCMGRCGADCGGGAPSAWTKDCMDHDQCSQKNNSSGGARDRNCGDEFNEAADDWMFGVIRGCRG